MGIKKCARCGAPMARGREKICLKCKYTRACKNCGVEFSVDNPYSKRGYCDACLSQVKMDNGRAQHYNKPQEVIKINKPKYTLQDVISVRKKLNLPPSSYYRIVGMLERGEVKP